MIILLLKTTPRKDSIGGRQVIYHANECGWTNPRRLHGVKEETIMIEKREIEYENGRKNETYLIPIRC
jgi:hypothetical protein